MENLYRKIQERSSSRYSLDSVLSALPRSRGSIVVVTEVETVSSDNRREYLAANALMCRVETELRTRADERRTES